MMRVLSDFSILLKLCNDYLEVSKTILSFVYIENLPQ